MSKSVSYPKCVRVMDITLEEQTEQYRYWLFLPFYSSHQDVKQKSEPLCVILKNPSVANKNVCDHTISKVCNVANHHHYPGVIILNLFPFRSTKPSFVEGFSKDSDYENKMKKNLECIKECCTNRDVVYAWGTNTIRKTKGFSETYNTSIYAVLNLVKDVAKKEYIVMKKSKNEEIKKNTTTEIKKAPTPLHGLRWCNTSDLIEYHHKEK